MTLFAVLAGSATAAVLTIDGPAQVAEQAVRVTVPPPSDVIYTSDFTGHENSSRLTAPPATASPPPGPR